METAIIFRKSKKGNVIYIGKIEQLIKNHTLNKRIIKIAPKLKISLE